MNEWSTMKKLIWLRMLMGGGSSWSWDTATGSSPLSLVNAVAKNITPEIKAQAKAKLADWFGEEYDEDQLDSLK